VTVHSNLFHCPFVAAADELKKSAPKDKVPGKKRSASKRSAQVEDETLVTDTKPSARKRTAPKDWKDWNAGMSGKAVFPL